MPAFETIFNANTTSFFICMLILVTVIAVWLIIRQNSKLIEESTRPYIAVSFDNTDNHFGDTCSGVFVIHNYGKTSAAITRFQYPDILKTQPSSEQYQAVRGMTLSPGQSILLPYDIDCATEALEFKLIYHAAAVGKNYSDNFSFRTAMLTHMQTKPEKDGMV